MICFASTIKIRMPSVVVCLLVVATVAIGQDDPKLQRSPEIRESILDTFFLKRDGEDGKYFQYFGITFEEFEEAYKIIKSKKSSTAPIGFTIRSVSVVAKIRDKVATLDVEMAVSTTTTGSVLIPVGFSNAMFVASSQEIIRKNGSYFYALKSDKNLTNKKIAFSLKQNIVATAGRKTLALKFPSATFRSIQIHELASEQVFSAPNASITSSIEPFFRGGSAIEIRNLPEASEVSWMSEKSRMTETSNVSVENVAVEAVVFPDKIAYQLKMDFLSEQASVGFRIGLPKGASDVSIESEIGVIQKSESSESEDWDVYAVLFSKSQTRISNLMIKWQSTDIALLHGFQLFQIDVESATLNLSFDDQSEFEITNANGLSSPRRNSLNRLAAKINDSNFSAELIQIRKADSLDSSVDYRIEFGRNSTQLSLKIPGPMLNQASESLRIRLQNWELLPSQIAFDAATVSNNEVNFEVGKLQLSDNGLVVEFILRSPPEQIENLLLPYVQDMPIGLRKFELVPGRFQEVVFDPNSNPSLNINSEEMAEAADSTISGWMSSSSPVSLTCLDETTRQIKLMVRQIELVNRVDQVMEIRDQHGSFFLTTDHQVRSNRDFQTLAIQVDSEIQPNFQLNGKPVASQIVKDGDERFFMIRLPGPVLSTRITCIAEMDEIVDSDSFSLKVPRVFLPLSTSASSTTETTEINGRAFVESVAVTSLSVITAPNRNVLPDDNWQLSKVLRPGEDKIYRPIKTTDVVTFQKANSSEDDLSVERVWCLTSLNSDFRRDRIVVKFQPKSSVIDWQLPENTKLEVCLLNGQDVSSFYLMDKNQVRVTFDNYNKKNVIEFRLRYFALNERSRLRLQLPKTNRLLWSQSVLWSVQLPSNQFALNTSPNLSAIYSLAWTGFFLRPKPSISLSTLERESEAELTKLINGGENEYLFETFGSVDGETVYIISRRNLVFFFGLFFITLGCAFVSLSFLRRAFFLVILSAGVLILGIWYPLWFVQLLQIQIFIGFLICIGIVISRLTNWINPSHEETRIETNIPSIALAAPDSNMSRTRIPAENESKTTDSHGSEKP